MTAAAIMLVMGLGHLVLGMRSLASGRRGGAATGEGVAVAETAAPAPVEWAWMGGAWLVAAVGFAFATGVPWLTAGVAVAVSAVASALLASRSRLVSMLGVAAAIVALALAVLLDTAAVDAQSPAAQLLAVGRAAASLSPSDLVIGAAALLFLTASSNTLVRAVVGAARGSDERVDATPDEPESWRVMRRGREFAVLRKGEPERIAGGFRGGRIVGPLERVLVFASLVAGMPVVIAGLVAAKGVVRFPEISADRSGGMKAEEFLVGTLCSFLLASLSVLALVARPG